MKRQLTIVLNLRMNESKFGIPIVILFYLSFELTYIIYFFRYIHDENVKLALRSLSTTESSEKHRETNIEWLENELQQAKDIIGLTREWIEKCNEL